MIDVSRYVSHDAVDARATKLRPLLLTTPWALWALMVPEALIPDPSLRKKQGPNPASESPRSRCEGP